MNDFDYDCAQKKRIARGAFNRKSTTNRKGCRLPHENLTKKELEKLNGEVTTVSMMKPIPWDDFKALSPDLQAEYLNTQVRRFGAGINTIGTELFHLSQSALHRHIGRLGLEITPAPNGQMPKAAKESWKRWLATGSTIAPESETTEDTYRAETQYTHCEPAPSATGSAQNTVKPFRAHDHKTDPFLQLFTDCGLERDDKRDELTEDVPENIYPLTGMNLELKGTPIDILATLRMSFPALLDKDKTYRFTIKADTFVISTPGRAL